MFVFMEIVYHGDFRDSPKALRDAWSVESSRVEPRGLSRDDAR